MIPEDHQTYVEVFAGGAWVLFGKEPSSTEELNDLNGELVNFWRVIKQRPWSFVAELKYLVASREIFHVLKSMDTCYLSEVVRAVRFFYLNKNSFGAKGVSLAAGPGRHRSINFDKLDELIERTWERLQTVLLENFDYRKILSRYDRKSTFFYLDPPYVECPGCYDHEFAEDDHKMLAEALWKIKGRFLLSYNDHPVVRKLYKGLSIQKITANYSLNDKRIKEAPQVLIKNY